MKHLKTINELHQDTYDSYHDKRLYNYLKDNHPDYLEENDIYSMYDMGTNINDIFEWSSENGHTEVVKTLLKDPRVDPSDDNNYTIRYASHNGHLEVVKTLLNDERIDPSDNNNDAIIWASEYGHLEIVKLLLKDPRVDPSDYDNDAILWASYYGHLDIIRLLVSDERVQQESGMSEEELLKKYIK